MAAGRPGRVPRFALGALARVSIQGYRAARELEFAPGSVCALVGEASSGKSTVLTAIWTLLEAAAPPPTIDDVARDATGGRIHLEAGSSAAARSSSTRARPTRSTSTARARRPCSSCRRTSARGRSSRPRPARARPTSPSSCARRSPDHHWAAADGGLAARARDGAPPRVQPAPLRPPHRGAGALPQPARAAASVSRAPRARAAGQPDPLLDARAGVPQRRPARGARARPPHDRPRDDAAPAAAAPGGGVVSRALGVRQRPRRALPRARRAPRRGPHGEAHVPAPLRRARRRGRQGGDHRARVRRQGQHAALRTHLQRVRDPVRRRARPRRAKRASGRSSRSASSTARSSRSPAGGARSC